MIKIDLRLFSEKYAVRRLGPDDVDLIYEISSENSNFYKYHPPFVTRDSIIEDMRALPQGKDYSDKFFVGFFDKNTLVAYMDLILSYPEEEKALIGFFMMNMRYQNKGIGSSIIKDTCNYLKHLGYKKARIGVDKGNKQSFSFWTKNNFHKVGESAYIIMEADL